MIMFSSCHLSLFLDRGSQQHFLVPFLNIVQHSVSLKVTLDGLERTTGSDHSLRINIHHLSRCCALMQGGSREASSADEVGDGIGEDLELIGDSLLQSVRIHRLSGVSECFEVGRVNTQ